jgi:hypothetical protein
MDSLGFSERVGFELIRDKYTYKKQALKEKAGKFSCFFQYYEVFNLIISCAFP